MLNQIWAAMIAVGFAYGIVAGNLQKMTDSMLGAAGDAVDLSITLLGVVAFWCGIMEIAQEAGLVQALSRKMRLVIHFLFPGIPEKHRSLEAISMNFIANILGLGWAATPAGLEAMEALAELEKEREEEKEQRKEQWKGWETKKRETKKWETKEWGIKEWGAKEWETKEWGAEGRNEQETKGKTENMTTAGIASNEMCTFLVLNISSLQLIPVNIIAYRSQYGSADPTAVVGPAILATTVSTAAAVVICKLMSRKM